VEFPVEAIVTYWITLIPVKVVLTKPPPTTPLVEFEHADDHLGPCNKSPKSVALPVEAMVT
jgi:hypothetical protein